VAGGPAPRSSPVVLPATFFGPASRWVAIIGAHTIGATFFNVLGLICGGYLCWLGFRAVTARRTEDETDRFVPRRPFRRGLALGLSNPVATFTALLAGEATAREWSALPPLRAAACRGTIVGDIHLIAVIGAGPVRRRYRRHTLSVTRGMFFLGLARGRSSQRAAGRCAASDP
jgi:threonine/homoserine/homoserine lactone efflux protein